MYLCMHVNNCKDCELMSLSGRGCLLSSLHILHSAGSKILIARVYDGLMRTLHLVFFCVLSEVCELYPDTTRLSAIPITNALTAVIPMLLHHHHQCKLSDQVSHSRSVIGWASWLKTGHCDCVWDGLPQHIYHSQRLIPVHRGFNRLWRPSSWIKASFLGELC